MRNTRSEAGTAEDGGAQPAPGWTRLSAWLAERLAGERDRWILWAPVAIGLGVAGYFSLTVEPPGWAGALGVAAGGGLAGAARRRPWARLAAVALTLAALGFAAAQARTVLVAAPQLRQPMSSAAVTGRVESIERTESGTRAVLAGPSVERLDRARTPGRIRLRFAGTMAPPPSGALVRVRANLLPPPGPAAPGAYDFRLTAFYAGIGAVGFAYAPAEVIDHEPDGWSGAFTAAVDRLRGRIADKVRAAAEGPAVPVTIALLNGEQTGISEDVMDAMRASGLAHLLSISGLHIALVAGIVFFVVRALLALVEWAALAWPIKKIAAACGLFAAVAYTLIVGSPVPTFRSVLMTGLVMLAVMLDRNPFSPRVFAFAAAVVLLAVPDSLLGPSFQMSFGAVAALIAGFEAAEPVMARWRRGTGVAGRALLWAGGLAFTSLLAGAATAPFALYHFQNVTFYGVAANMAAVPLTSFWVMPWGLIAYLLMPFGLEEPALTAMNWGSEGVVWVARTVASWPGARTLVPAMPVWGFGLAVAGGLWLCLWRRLWRLAGVPLILSGLLSPTLAVPPDVLVDGDGGLVAVRDAAGELRLSVPRGDRIAAETWLRRDGREERGAVWPRWGSLPGAPLDCDPLGCRYRRAGVTVAIVRDELAVEDDCRAADVVIAPETAVRRCRAPLVIDRWRLRRDGAHALWIGSDGVRTDSVRARNGDRPWTGR